MKHNPRNTHKPWSVTYRVNGIQKQKSFATKLEAKAFEASSHVSTRNSCGGLRVFAGRDTLARGA